MIGHHCIGDNRDGDGCKEKWIIFIVDYRDGGHHCIGDGCKKKLNKIGW